VQAFRASAAERRFVDDFNHMHTGRPELAVAGLAQQMKCEENTLFTQLGRGTQALIDEIAAYGTDEDRECLDYVLNQEAGSDAKMFSNSPYPRDCDGDGVRKDRTRTDGRGMMLADFVEAGRRKVSNLSEANVLALRLYTTAAFRSMNAPLRLGQQHRMPATIAQLAQGLSKLRAAAQDTQGPASDSTSAKPVQKRSGSGVKELSQVHELWRGMSNVQSTDAFRQQGGSEAAPMSTTSDPVVAVAYGQSRRCLLLKIVASNFVHLGADLSWLSAFPAEKEILYPPLTFLDPTGREATVHFGPGEIGAGSPEMEFQIIEVRPEIGHVGA